ncbi:MAG: MFS transporter [Bacteroidetes bacterium SW_9_63_38]|nr:MAG: MFS transporter [Bacteroidetes bacterium SW_9_63_38]
MATLAFFAGLTSIVMYGAAGPTFKSALGLTGVQTGLLLSSPQVSQALLRIPFGAWVDEVGGKMPFLILLGSTAVGMAGIVTVLFFYHPAHFGPHLYGFLLGFGLIGGAGGATFSVGIPQTSYWFPKDQQGYALGVFAGGGNIGPGVINYLLPVGIGLWGLTTAYAGWLSFVLAVTVLYAVFGIDSYYFQLRADGVAPDSAHEISRELGQEVFPSGDTWESLRSSALNHRTWILVFLYSVSCGGGLMALTAWFPTYWKAFHFQQEGTLWLAGLAASIYTIYGSLIRIVGGSLSDRYGGEAVATASFCTMAAGAGILSVAATPLPAFFGMMVLGTGMGVANAAVFELVPLYVPDAVGGASGWIGGIGAGGTLVVLPLLGGFVDVYGRIGYARGFLLFVLLGLICAGVSYFRVPPVPETSPRSPSEQPAH